VRDRRLDFWRGLCLVDMVLVHLVWEGLDVGQALAPAIGEYTRFAAGGFVFVAGAGVGLVFLPRARDPLRRAGAYGELWRRAAYILGVHYAATASFLALGVLRGGEALSGGALGAVRDVLTFREAPPYGDILPLYVALLALSPGLIEVLRRGLWPLIALASTGLFALGQQHPWALSPRAPEVFPLVLWQAVFVAGLLFGAMLPRLDRAPRAAFLGAAALAALSFAGLTLAAYGAALGLPLPTPLTFSKVPLSTGELLRYLAATLLVVLVTGLLWRRLERRALAHFVEVLGRRSLAVYVAHVWVQAAVMALAFRLAWLGEARVLLALPALAALGALAWGLEALPPRGLRRARVSAALRRGAALPAGAAAAALLVAALGAMRSPDAPGAGHAIVAIEGVDVIADVDAAELLVEVEPVELEVAPTAPDPSAPPRNEEPTQPPIPDPFHEQAFVPGAGLYA
jgi:hypothetical protein